MGNRTILSFYYNNWSACKKNVSVLADVSKASFYNRSIDIWKFFI